jgi:predicted Holliday junction resolvase-like endonuclease
MPIALVLIFVVVVVAVCLIGILWALAFLIPFYASIAAAVYFLWRSRKNEAELVNSAHREAERQRLFNEQEMRAWRASLEIERRNSSKREKVLRSLDKARGPRKN